MENGSEEIDRRLKHESADDEMDRSCDEDTDILAASDKKRVSEIHPPLFTEEDFDAFDNKQVSRFRPPSFTEEEKEGMQRTSTRMGLKDDEKQKSSSSK